MDSNLVKYFKKVQAAHRQVSRAFKAVAQNEPGMYQMLLSQEKQMETADGLGFTDEEIESNVMRQMENNAFRVALQKAQDNFTEVLMDG
mgnify:CR=1 FL=1